MTQTTNTQIDRIIKRTDEITEKELARQELPNPRTQTNTTQNKEELSKELEEEFNRRFVTYPASLVLSQWGGSSKNKTKKNQLLLIKNENKQYLTINALKNFIAKSNSQAHQSGIEEERKRIRKK